MGSDGYWILVWDDWGSGLVMINPRLIADGLDIYGNPKNWFSNPDELTEDEIITKHNLGMYEHYKIIRDD